MLEFQHVESLRAEPVSEEIPNRVSTAIRLLGLTQRSVANDVGMSEPHLSDVCRGQQKVVTLETARKLAEFFGCAIEDLFPKRAA